MFKEIRSWFEIKSISTKITLICSVFFIALIAVTNFASEAGKNGISISSYESLNSSSDDDDL